MELLKRCLEQKTVNELLLKRGTMIQKGCLTKSPALSNV